MKKKSSIVKLSIIGVLIVIGLVLSFSTFDIGLKTYKSFASSIKLGLDLKGGIYAVYEADPSGEDFDSRMEGTKESLQALLMSKGFTEATVTREGTDRIRVEVPDISDPKSILEILGEPADLQFVLNGQIVLTGEHVVSATAGYYDNSAVVSLAFNSEGARLFADITTNNIGSTMEIKTVIAGQEPRTISSASINTAITNGQAMITGIGSFEDAESLANQIMSGTFGVTLSLKETSTISAYLGESALKWGVIAGIIGLLLVMALMIYLYRMFGVIASVNLMIYVIAMLFILAVFPWVQLTLPGIAGILLSIGMSLDGNIIIFERIKDEYRNGKSIKAATHYGFRRSINAILDANVTTAIAAVMLVIFPTGAIKGFAITLIIGLVLSVIGSLFMTRVLVKYFFDISDKSPALYNLKRGKNYEGLAADKTASEVQKQIESELAKKAKEAQDKEDSRVNDNGGLYSEAN